MATLSHAHVSVFRLSDVDMKVGGVQYNFILARAGAVFVPTLLVARTMSAVGSTEQFGGYYSIGNNVGLDNIFPQHAMYHDYLSQIYPLANCAAIDLSSDTVMLSIQTGASGTSLSGEFFLEGYYFAGGYGG